ncbi:recombinase family protein [Synechococcus sp. MU1611]|nr:recombinase family protein [Synechococcus sp. MU1650]MCB4411057.1 recombinase family protein [Synechococcus sp. MU1611]
MPRPAGTTPPVTGCDLLLIETGSATSADRPKYQQLLSLIEGGTVATVIAARDDRLNRNIGVQRYPFLLCRSRSTTIDLLEDGAWASVAHDDLALEEISSRLKRSYRSAEEAGLSIILQNRELQ